jgi:DEAD/DEAH box helicase domain-containing protein
LQTVKTVVFGYYRLDRKGRIMDSHDVYMDPFIIHSTGVWVDVPGQAISRLESLDIDPMAAIHALCTVIFYMFLFIYFL